MLDSRCVCEIDNFYLMRKRIADLTNRTTEWLELERTFPEAGPPRGSCPEPCPDGFRISPRTEAPQILFFITSSNWKNEVKCATLPIKFILTRNNSLDKNSKRLLNH